MRTHPDWKLEVHIDTDEANCCDLTHATKVTLVQAVIASIDRSTAIPTRPMTRPKEGRDGQLRRLKRWA